jgi:hypothetical protein
MLYIEPIPVAARYKAWVGGRLPDRIAGSNSARGMDVCPLWVLCVVRYTSLHWADHSYREVLPSVVRLKRCDCEASIMRRPWSTRGCCAMEYIYIYICIHTYIHIYTHTHTHAWSIHACIYTYTHTVKFVGNITIYWTTEHIFSRQTPLESLWFGAEDCFLCFYQSLHKKMFLIKRWRSKSTVMPQEVAKET